MKNQRKMLRSGYWKQGVAIFDALYTERNQGNGFKFNNDADMVFDCLR